MKFKYNIIIVIIVLAILPYKIKGKNMTITRQDKQKMKQEMYLTHKKVNGVLCDTYYFGGWSGYSHPVTLKYPLRYSETQDENRSSYYEASFMNKKDMILFVFLEEIKLIRKPLVLNKNFIEKKGSHFYLVLYDENKIVKRGDKVDLKDTINEKEYIHIKFDSENKIRVCEIVKI